MAWRDLNLRTRGLGFDGAAMAGPPNQNPKKRRLIQVQLKLGLMLALLSLRLFWQNGQLINTNLWLKSVVQKTGLFKTLEANPRCKTNQAQDAFFLQFMFKTNSRKEKVQCSYGQAKTSLIKWLIIFYHGDMKPQPTCVLAPQGFKD